MLSGVLSAELAHSQIGSAVAAENLQAVPVAWLKSVFLTFFSVVIEPPSSKLDRLSKKVFATSLVYYYKLIFEPSRGWWVYLTLH
jgi:hypothetical protein